jgi:adenylate kinase family enzyme
MTPQRIAILGTSGAGKTTLGRALAARLDAPFVEIDAIQHKAGWTPASDEELRDGIERVIAGRERWVIDNTCHRRLGELITGPAELLVWLDLPIATKFLRLVRRSWRRVTTREILWNGNYETWRDVVVGRGSVLQHMVRSHFRQRRELPYPAHAHKTLRLRRVADVDRWLATF